MAKSTFLAHHVRDKNGIPFATLVALSATAIGLAVCNKKDTFTKKLGLVIAAGRAALETPLPTIRNDNRRNAKIIIELGDFQVRANKYFNKEKRENAATFSANIAKGLATKRRKKKTTSKA